MHCLEASLLWQKISRDHQKNWTFSWNKYCLSLCPKRIRPLIKPLLLKNSFSTNFQGTGPWEGPVHFSRFVLRFQSCSKLSRADPEFIFLCLFPCLFLFLSLSLSVPLPLSLSLSLCCSSSSSSSSYFSSSSSSSCSSSSSSSSLSLSLSRSLSLCSFLFVFVFLLLITLWIKT